ncbi:MAG: hypothetical protein GXP62_04640 [Oligoflexia bacterium]|nr:hypothetical protein [Oligoflexia bacterium]
MTVSPSTSAHTIVVSDLHVTDAQKVRPRLPLWKRYRQRDLFIDGSFDRLVDYLLGQVNPDSELVLAGDIFDFDSVMRIPVQPPFHVSWLERRRGLGATQDKSCFKLHVILRDHPVFLATLRKWVVSGHRLVFVIGNHDIELHWPAVQQALIEALALPDRCRAQVRICEWFYIAGGDTLIEHGNQFDAYCLCNDPVSPTIRWRGQEIMRVPFGNLAERYMLNGMGLFNPHAESSFIMSMSEYVRFFLKYLIRTQPLLAFTWLWSSIVTLVATLRESFLPAYRRPLLLEARMAGIARRANATVGQVVALGALRVHPAAFTPWKLMRELWLDRALILALLIGVSFQVVTVYNVFSPISPWWALAIFGVLLPPFIFYARGVNSDVDSTERVLRRRLPDAVQIAHADRVVVGHTHVEHHTRLSNCELINTGTWSPAYHDVECTQPYGRKCFAWIRPVDDGPRQATLCEWTDPQVRVLPVVDGAGQRPAGLLAALRAQVARPLGKF